MARTSNHTTSGLTPAQLEQQRLRLVRLRATLLGRLSHEQSVVREGEPLYEPLEVAQQTREQDDAVLFSQHDATLLTEIDHALAKIPAGRYGLSEASGEPIELRRLQAVPWARFTADEEEDEQAQRQRDGDGDQAKDDDDDDDDDDEKEA